jgi:hypothetical protein
MKNGKNTACQFAAGITSRPKGSRNKATLAAEIPFEAKQIGIAL